VQFLIKKRKEKFSVVLFSSSIFGRQTLDPFPNPEPDSLEMLDPD